MSILTKEEREGIRRKHRAESIADAAVIRALLDTIDAMEGRLSDIWELADALIDDFDDDDELPDPDFIYAVLSDIRDLSKKGRK